MVESGQGSFITSQPAAPNTSESEAFFATPSPDKKNKKGNEPKEVQVEEVDDDDFLQQDKGGSLNELEDFENFNAKLSFNCQEDYMPGNTSDGEVPEQQYSDTPEVIEETLEEYRSNEDVAEEPNMEEPDLSGIAADIQEQEDQFEGLRQRAVSDDIQNPYITESKKKKQPDADDDFDDDQIQEIKEIKLNNKHSKALMSTEYEYLKRDPEEEFFMLAVLALKMVHNEEYEEAEYVYEISAGKLFRQVRNQNLPFHRWYKWLESKFLELRNAFILEKEPKDSELTKWNVDADKAIEIKE